MYICDIHIHQSITPLKYVYFLDNSSDMVDEIFYTKSDKVYKLIDKIKRI